MNTHPQKTATIDLLTIGEEGPCREVAQAVLGDEGVIEQIGSLDALDTDIPQIRSGLVVLCGISASAEDVTALRGKLPGETVVAGVMPMSSPQEMVPGLDLVVAKNELGLAALARVAGARLMEEDLADVMADRQTLIEAVPHSMILLNQNAEILEANHHAMREFSLQQPFAGQSLMSIVSDKRRERWRNALNKAGEAAHPVSFHEEDGNRWLMVGFYPVRSTDGELLRIAVGVTDETAHRRTMNRRSIVPVIAEICSAATDLTQLYQHVPMVISEQFGFPAVAFALYTPGTRDVEVMFAVGEPARDMTFPCRLPREKSIPVEVYEDSRPRIVTDVLNNPDYCNCLAADYGYQTMVSVPIWAENQPMGAILLADAPPREDAHEFTDILQLVAHQLGSEILRRRAQVQLRESQKLASLGTLTAGIAHEISNPNTFLLMNAPLAKDIWAGIELELAQAATNHSDLKPAGLSFADAVERLPRLLDAIEDGAKRIDKIVTGLKTYSRQSPADTRELINISDAIESAATLTASRIREASEQFAVTVAPELPRIIGDRQRLEQVLINLILNACDAMPDTDGRIEIHADSDAAEGMVRITVSDNGVGIPSDQLAHVTDPFFTTKRDQGGTGLGLSIATGIVSDFGGQIKIESRLGQGTTVRLLLPFGILHRE